MTLFAVGDADFARASESEVMLAFGGSGLEKSNRRFFRRAMRDVRMTIARGKGA
jgi:hypothetical protein